MTFTLLVFYQNQEIPKTFKTISVPRLTLALGLQSVLYMNAVIDEECSVIKVLFIDCGDRRDHTFAITTTASSMLHVPKCFPRSLTTVCRMI